MKRERCCLDIGALFDPMWSRAWRCLNCGHATGSVMAANRHRQAVLISSRREQEESVLETDRTVMTGISCVAELPTAVSTALC
jgi:hypothetical protein